MTGIQKACRILAILSAIVMLIPAVFVLIVAILCINPSTEIIEAVAEALGTTNEAASEAIASVLGIYFFLAGLLFIGIVIDIIVAARASKNDGKKGLDIFLGVLVIVSGFLPTGIVQIVKGSQNNGETNA